MKRRLETLVANQTREFAWDTLMLRKGKQRYSNSAKRVAFHIRTRFKFSVVGWKVGGRLLATDSVDQRFHGGDRHSLSPVLGKRSSIAQTERERAENF